MKILHLTLKRKWFDKILCGEKKEEYREIKPYWDVRLKKQYDAVCFKNGYSKDSPSFLIELKSIKKGIGKAEYGANQEEVYVLALGKVISDENKAGEKMESLSFDHLVTYYDETRDFDIQSFEKALKTISSIVPPDRYRKVFEPGIGNGRIAIPMNKLGYEVTGIDISQNMLNELNQRIKKEGIIGLNYQIGDVSCIPYDDLSFDATIATHLFYFVSEWEKACDEIARVTKGPIIMLHTGMGQEISILNEKYKTICQAYGVKFPQIGVSSTKEVVDYFKLKGYHVLFEGKWSWKKKVDVEIAIGYLKKRAYSFTGWANNNVHNKVIRELRAEKIGISEVEDRISLVILERTLHDA